MHRVIFGYLVAVFLVISILIYQPSVEGLLPNVIISLTTLQLALMALQTKNGLLKLISVVGWFFLYPITFYQLFSVASVSWSGGSIWTAGDLPSFLTYLGCLLFSLVAATTSMQSFMRVLKLKSHTQLAVMPIAAIYASLTVHVIRTANLGWMDFIVSPLIFFQKVFANMATIDLTFLLGFAAIQMILPLILSD